MKKLMTGNEALARGFWEAGGKFVSSYPGTPSTEITENAAKYDEIYAEWAPNEKVAFESGLGAAMGGVRALVAMKHVGLNVAADPLFTAAYTGINGGLVIVSADDPNIYSSQNEQDNRNYAKAAKVPMLEPSDSQEVLDFTKKAFEISEEFDIPVLLRLTTRICHSKSFVECCQRVEVPRKEYRTDVDKYVMISGKARARHALLEEKIKALADLSDSCSLNSMDINDTSIGIVCSGVVYHYIKEALPEASILKIGFTYPLPKRLIHDFASKVDTMYVIEELDPFMEDMIKSWGLKIKGKELFSLLGEVSYEDIKEKITGETTAPSFVYESIPPRPPLLCPGCPHRGVFYIFNRLRLNVPGDIGCYTLGHFPPFSSVHSAICMGASIGVAHGLAKAIGDDFSKKTVAVIGESTFVHSGITSLINVVYNQSNTTTVILDNSITAMTGHQPNPISGYNAKGQVAPVLDLAELCHVCGIDKVSVVDPFDLTAFEKAMKESLEYEGPAVVISKRPCILLDKKAKSIPLYVNEDKCTGCKVCLKVGCPALGKKVDEQGQIKTFIEPNQCTACRLCAQVCPHDAIGEGI
ncbi:MAG: indolepyruvate ferredoxin oxidoreductase subunit alpha [Bacillota bacterium]|jgi:indolepyruvate ferredoxin oxidoreductase alpha subunit